MKQVIQNFKTGQLYVDDLPAPSIAKGMVLVENEFSLISAGTERGTVKVAQSSLIGKAKQRPDLVAQVLQNIKKEGLAATFSKVKTKLDSLKALGYSTAGRVVASKDTGSLYKPGDRVACAGQDYASHAELVAVPQNLLARIPDNVSTEEASFTTLGAIAMQGIRQAKPRLGENVCVIGLGLLGQISCQLLRANGCRVLGIDLSEELVEIAQQHSADTAMSRQHDNLMAACENFTEGRGFDAVVITAATSSNDPVELSGQLARKKGRVVIVGDVKMDLPRNPHYYRKELSVRLSCSYGPGRYDVHYEEQGLDYPYAYVRWTEQRNMQAFLDLLSRKLIDIKPLITHVFDIEQAEKAYDLVLEKVKEPHIGILLKYARRQPEKQPFVRVGSHPRKKINAGFIGAGSFAQSYLLPAVKSFGASLETVVTSRGITAKNVADKFGFNACATDPGAVFDHSDINTVFIATHNASHAGLVLQAWQAGKAVFVEKPLAINMDQLRSVMEARTERSAPLMTGFNRRFAPLTQQIKAAFDGVGEPLVLNLRINAGALPKEHWMQRAEVGGGRIIGEMCHFVDLCQYFTGARPVKVYAESIQSDNDLLVPDDNIVIVIRFDDGSVANLSYLANGNNGMPKERIEVFGAGKIGLIDDFRSGSLFLGGKTQKIKASGKGHREEVHAFLQAVKAGRPGPIDFESICLTTLTTFRIVDSLHTGRAQDINLDHVR